MKVILLKDVAKLGRRHSIVDVPDGYALNKLIPTRQAEPATAANLKRIRAVTGHQADQAAEAVSAFQAALASLQGKTLTHLAEANAQGHLFQAVKVQDIMDSLSALNIHGIPGSSIELASPIKDCGEHSIPVHLAGHSGTLTLVVAPK